MCSWPSTSASGVLPKMKMPHVAEQPDVLPLVDVDAAAALTFRLVTWQRMSFSYPLVWNGILGDANTFVPLIITVAPVRLQPRLALGARLSGLNPFVVPPSAVRSTQEQVGRPRPAGVLSFRSHHITILGGPK